MNWFSFSDLRDCQISGKGLACLDVAKHLQVLHLPQPPIVSDNHFSEYCEWFLWLLKDTSTLFIQFLLGRILQGNIMLTYYLFKAVERKTRSWYLFVSEGIKAHQDIWPSSPHYFSTHQTRWRQDQAENHHPQRPLRSHGPCGWLVSWGLSVPPRTPHS